MAQQKTVMQRLLSGWQHPVSADMAFQDGLAAWHGDKQFQGTCAEYLGFTPEEYQQWRGDASAAERILAARRL